MACAGARPVVSPRGKEPEKKENGGRDVDLAALVGSLNLAVESDRPGAQIKVLMNMYAEAAGELVRLKQRPNMNIQTLQRYKQKGMEALMRAEQLKALFDKGLTVLPSISGEGDTAGHTAAGSAESAQDKKAKHDSDAMFAQISGAIVTANPNVRYVERAI